MSTVKVIKKYKNRKLYDTENSTYTSLNKILKLHQDGTSLIVIEDVSKEDITSEILFRAYFERETTHGKLSLKKVSELLTTNLSAE
jgi:polyhydroxyalkanoate synthesis repressor PhaR